MFVFEKDRASCHLTGTRVSVTQRSSPHYPRRLRSLDTPRCFRQYAVRLERCRYYWHTRMRGPYLSWHCILFAAMTKQLNTSVSHVWNKQWIKKAFLFADNFSRVTVIHSTKWSDNWQTLIRTGELLAAGTEYVCHYICLGASFYAVLLLHLFSWSGW